MRAVILGADSLGIQLMQPPLATSELDPELASVQKSGEETVISNRPRSQNGGKKVFRYCVRILIS